jgi:hypothetical protein
VHIAEIYVAVQSNQTRRGLAILVAPHFDCASLSTWAICVWSPRSLSYDLILGANNSDVALYARINLEMIGKLSAESCDLYGLA